MPMHSCIARAAVGAAVASVVGPALGQQTYTLTDIGHHGAVVGSMASHINASGEIVGYTENSAGTNLPFSWTPTSPNATTGTYALLSLPSGASYGFATGVNGAGQICGTSSTVVTTKQGPKTSRTTVYTYPIVWSNGAPSYLLNGGKSLAGTAYGINDSGEIVGDFGLWSNGKVYALPGSLAMSVNKGGQVAGLYAVSANSFVGYLWTPNVANGTSGGFVTFPFEPAQGERPWAGRRCSPRE